MQQCSHLKFDGGKSVVSVITQEFFFFKSSPIPIFVESDDCFVDLSAMRLKHNMILFRADFNQLVLVLLLDNFGYSPPLWVPKYLNGINS